MKYENYIHDREKLSNSARRTLRELGTAAAKLISEKKLEDISVKDICDESMVSKSSFYNYFDDKLDLVWYLMWYFTSEAMKAFYSQKEKGYVANPDEELMYIIEKSLDICDYIYRLNPVGSLFHNEWTTFMIKSREKILTDEQTDVPDKIRMQINMYAISVVINFCLVNDLGRDQTWEYIRKMMR